MLSHLYIPVVVSITELGKIYVGQDEVTMDALALKLEGIKQNADEENVIIRADKSTNIETVIRVIDASKGVGIDKFTIETEKESY